MKRIYLVVFLFFSANQSFSQKYIDEMVKNICECLNNMPPGKNPNDAQREMVTFMLKSGMTYKNQIKKDFGIDLNKANGEDGEKFGRLIGSKLASYCPKSLRIIIPKTTATK